MDPKEIVTALKSLMYEIQERLSGKLEEDDWNPDYLVGVSLSIAEMRVIKRTLSKGRIL